MRIHNVLATKGTDVLTIRPEQTLREAIALLSRFNIGGLVVVDEARNPLGIITERDIIRQAARDEALFAQPVQNVMTTDLIVAAAGGRGSVRRPHHDRKAISTSADHGSG